MNPIANRLHAFHQSIGEITQSRSFQIISIIALAILTACVCTLSALANVQVASVYGTTSILAHSIYTIILPIALTSFVLTLFSLVFAQGSLSKPSSSPSASPPVTPQPVDTPATIAESHDQPMARPAISILEPIEQPTEAFAISASSTLLPENRSQLVVTPALTSPEITEQPVDTVQQLQPFHHSSALATHLCRLLTPQFLTLPNNISLLPQSYPLRIAINRWSPLQTHYLLRLLSFPNRLPGHRSHSAPNAWRLLPAPSVAELAEQPVKPPPTAMPAVASMIDIRTASPGKMIFLSCHVGQIVEKGDRIAELEIMKMYISIHADRRGTISEILVKAGDIVEPQQVIARIEPSEAPAAPAQSVSTTKVEICAPMPGKMVLKCRVGQTVKEGDPIGYIDSMKMEITITAHQSGTISEILVKEGEILKSKQAILRIEPEAII